MRGKELISLMQKPHLVDESVLSSLNEMVEKFPYSSVFQLLLAKGMHNLGDLSLDERIRKAAIITPDRGALYDLIYAKNMQAIIDKVESSIDEVVESDPKEQVKTVEPIEVMESEMINETIIENDSSVDDNKKEVTQDRDDLQQDILLEAINTTIQLDVDELLKEDRFAEVETNEEQSEDQTSEVVDAFTTPLRFSDWLVSMKTIDDKVEEEKVTRKLSSSQDLIDRFISSKSKKIDVTKEPLTPQELGKLSLVENEDFVTETLAGIYAKQGKFAKAIKIYQQLILNFPEKSTFFASRIRFLKEKMEYDNN